jgi:hypothetical protein
MQGSGYEEPWLAEDHFLRAVGSRLVSGCSPAFLIRALEVST